MINKTQDYHDLLADDIDWQTYTGKGKPKSVSLPEPQKYGMSKDDKMEWANRVYGLDRTPFDTVSDFGSAMIKALGKGGQTIGNLMDKSGMVPHVDLSKSGAIGKAIAQGATQDVGETFKGLGSNSKGGANPFVEGAGSFAPYALAGGASLPGMMAAGVAHGALTAQDDEPTLLGRIPALKPFMPKGKLGAAIEEPLLTLLGSGIGKGISQVPKAMNYLNPGKAADEFLTNLTGGAKNAEQNIAELSKRTKLAYDVNKNEALADKKMAMTESKGRDILKYNQAEGNLPTVAGLFESDPNQISQSKLAAISKAIKTYRKSGDLNELAEEGEHIFGSKELSQNQMDKLEHLVSIPENQYMKLSEDILPEFSKNSSFTKAHNAFIKKASLKNADELQQEMGFKIGQLKNKQSRQGRLEGKEEDLLGNLIGARNALKKEAFKFLEHLSPEAKKGYESYFQKWRENVEPYHQEDIIKRMAKGESQGISPSQVKSAYAFPSKDTSKILGDLGDSGKRNVLLNEFQGKNKPADLAEAILKAKSEKGYSEYITPEMERFAKKLMKQVSASEFAKDTAVGVGSATVGGLVGANPLLGALIGLGGTKGLKYLKNALSKVK